MTSVALTTRPPAELAVDTLVVDSVQTPDGADLATGHHLPRKAVVHLQAVLSDVEATGNERGIRRPPLDVEAAGRAAPLSPAANRSLRSTARSSRTSRPSSRGLRNDR